MSNLNLITRRSALGALAIGGQTLLNAAPHATGFALIGDRYHNSDYIRTGLGKTLGKDLGISIDFCDEVKMLTADHLRSEERRVGKECRL